MITNFSFKSYSKYIIIFSHILLIMIIIALLISQKRGRRIREFIMKSQIDRSKGWFPHEVGNYWINRDFIPCDLANKAWYWEVTQLKKTDSADFFLIEKQLNPCDSTEYSVYKQWYAYTKDDKMYMVDDKFEYYDLEADFSLDQGESFIRQGLRYTLIDKTENRLIFEYDLYEDDTYHYVFEKGIGQEIGWEEFKISGKVYYKDINRMWKELRNHQL